MTTRPRDVDVTIRGRNLASPAFRGAGTDVEGFANRVARLVNPLNFLKGIIAGLGIASLGALFRRATTAAIEHEKSLGRNIVALDRLSAAWDFVLVRLGQAILGFERTGGFAENATTALAQFGQWIDDNKGTIQEFANIVLAIASALKALPGAMRGAAMGLPGIDPARLDALGIRNRRGVGGAGRSYGDSFDDFLRDQERARQREEAERERKEREREAKSARARERDEQDRAFKKLMEGTAWYNDAYLRGQVGATPSGGGMRGPSGTPALDVGTPITEGLGALDEFQDKVTELARDAIPNLADAWAEAMHGVITGSMTAAQALRHVFVAAIGGTLIADGRANLLQAAAILVKGIAKGNPIEWALAGKLAGIGTAEIGLGSLFQRGGGSSGGYGGGVGGLGSGGFATQRNEMDRGDATIVIQGGILDTGNPQQMDALAAAIAELSGRRVIVVGGTG